MKIIKDLKEEIERYWKNRYDTHAVGCSLCRMRLRLDVIEKRSIDSYLWERIAGYKSRKTNI